MKAIVGVIIAGIVLAGCSAGSSAESAKQDYDGRKNAAKELAKDPNMPKQTEQPAPGERL